jgi:hypothetical protein
MASLVSYDSVSKLLTINGINFDLTKYDEKTGMFDEAPKVSVRNKIATISLGGDVKVNDFYDGDNNQYTLLNALEDNDVLNERVTKIENILSELKATSQDNLKQLVPNVNANVEIDGDTFTKLLSIVMFVTKILTGVLILQKVSQAKCQFKPQKQERQTELDRKIASLEGFLQSTSSLLFKMDTI